MSLDLDRLNAVATGEPVPPVKRTRRQRCARDAHDNVPVRGRELRIRCTACGEEFPCRDACKHYDCAAARERWPAFPVPDPWLGRDPAENAIPILVDFGNPELPDTDP